LAIPSPARRSLWGNIARAAKLENHSPLWRVLPWGKRRTSGEIILFLKIMAGACAEIRFERLGAIVPTIAPETAAPFHLGEGCSPAKGTIYQLWIGSILPPSGSLHSQSKLLNCEPPPLVTTGGGVFRGEGTVNLTS
jgi:hypothetical protein